MSERANSTSNHERLPTRKDVNKSSQVQTPRDAQSQINHWQSLKKQINDQVANCDETNLKQVVFELFRLNLHRGKGLLIRSIMRAQLNNSSFTPVYASLISVINSKIPEVGELLLFRLILQFKKNYMANNQRIVRTSIAFICQLVNQRVASEILVLEILQLLLDRNPTNETIELSVEILQHTGKLLSVTSALAFNMIYDRLRNLLHEDHTLTKKTQRTIEVSLKWKRNQFRDFVIMKESLDLVEEEDQQTHIIELRDELKPREELNVYRFDSEFEDHELQYDKVRRDILGDDDDDDEEDEDHEDNEEEEAKLELEQEVQQIKDMTESNLIEHQKKIYLLIMSSMSSDEAVHKLLQWNKRHQHEDDVLVDMIVKCCAQEKTYSKYFGVIGEKICSMSSRWHSIFVASFKKFFEIIHQFESNQLRNIGKFFGHLFASDRLAIEQSWNEIRLTESDTNSASRVFIKFIFQEMIEEVGVKMVKEMITDPYVKSKIGGIFPVEQVSWQDADHIRFSINFFTAIGLGVLTEEMRDVLKNLPAPPPLEDEERGRGRSRGDSRSSSYSRSRSGSYSRSRSGSYSRSRSGSYSRSRSGSYRTPSRSPRSRSFSRSQTPSRAGSPLQSK